MVYGADVTKEGCFALVKQPSLVKTTPESPCDNHVTNNLNYVTLQC